MIFQDPSSSLNPVFSIGQQIGDVLRVNEGLNKRAAIGAESNSSTASGSRHRPSGSRRIRTSSAEECDSA